MQKFFLKIRTCVLKCGNIILQDEMDGVVMDDEIRKFLSSASKSTIEKLIKLAKTEEDKEISELLLIILNNLDHL